MKTGFTVWWERARRDSAAEEEEATKFKPNQGREGKNCRFVGRAGERERQKLLKSWGKKSRPAEITGIELL